MEHWYTFMGLGFGEPDSTSRPRPTGKCLHLRRKRFIGKRFYKARKSRSR